MAEYKPFLKWLECTCGKKDKHGVIKLFKTPCKKLTSDGMPDKKYRWLCNFEVSGANQEKIFMHSTMKAPPRGGLTACIEKARQMGCRELYWERLKNGKIVIRKFLI